MVSQEILFEDSSLLGALPGSSPLFGGELVPALGENLSSIGRFNSLSTGAFSDRFSTELAERQNDFRSPEGSLLSSENYLNRTAEAGTIISINNNHWTDYIESPVSLNASAYSDLLTGSTFNNSNLENKQEYNNELSNPVDASNNNLVGDSPSQNLIVSFKKFSDGSNNDGSDGDGAQDRLQNTSTDADDGDGDEDDDECLKLAQNLTRNPNCASSNGEVLLSKERLADIGRVLGVGSNNPGDRGRFEDKLGQLFEQAALESLQVDPYQGNPLNAPRRLVESNFTAPGTSTPDAIGSLVYTEFDNQGRVIRRFTEDRSAFYEVKQLATGSSITRSSFDYEAIGYLDLAARSPAGVNDLYPSVIFVTTSGVNISPDLVREASAELTAVWQIQVYESCANPGFIRTGLTPLPLNAGIYTGSNIVPEPVPTGQLVSLPNLAASGAFL